MCTFFIIGHFYTSLRRILYHIAKRKWQTKKETIRR
nr:MAG TPA: hypothetical protein [Caudoviricetes sp.]DAH44082.1 MAG TPA: hypothetical protein [Caudoviricetes sp.]DAM40553.1 MAG TPA: hypothetical protein [Caudoviricetes sp.]